MMDEASRRQISAARPDISTWVSANAGSGKTKVLTDRVARLLLDGTPPQHILCLTYTKAAAAEMQNRLFKRLGEWAMLPDDALIKMLSGLAPDKNLDSKVLRHARTLFARAIETPGGLKIQTIHSFCSALLRRFPLEAGVSPQFKEMDERSSKRMIADLLEELAQGDGQSAIDDVSYYVSDLGLDAISQRIIANRDLFSPPRSQEDIWTWFDLPKGFTDTDLIELVFQGDEKDMFHSCGTLLKTSGKTDQKLAEVFANWAGLEPSLSLIAQCCEKLLSGAGTKTPHSSKFGARHSGIPAKKLREEHPDTFEPLKDFMERVEAARPMLYALSDAKRTQALHQFAQTLLPPFLEKKSQLGLLDFDDMIRRARDLLSISNVSQWVLYRLDGGIDHILVDEAQDTSPEQWDVIRLLATEFTAGEGARPDVTRTIFVVGDRKQSIYSFQGAAPEAFEKMKAHFADHLAAVDQPLQDVSLSHSFRSSKAILNATDAVFEASGGTGLGGASEHIAFFDTAPGRVDLWPLELPAETKKDPEEWEKPVDLVSEEHHTTRLARKVADFVADLLEHGTLPTHDAGGRPIEPGDIMILVRSRGTVFNRVLNALKSHAARIPVAGADRMKLGDEMAVKDIKSLLAFLSLQDDDLALAETLRSPLFNWSERDLYQLAHGRTTITLWRAFYEGRAAWPEAYDILEDLRQQSDFLRPYDLIERILIRHKGRQKLLARLGKEAEDGIDALLLQAQDFETRETPSLTGFVTWLDAQDVELKRVLDENSNLVRVMTAHGSKGLEAPIVILPETLKTQSETRDEILEISPGNAVWKSPSAIRSNILNETLIQRKTADIEEDRRLLYVAMTRAEKWLVICGAGHPQKEDMGTWYQLAQDGLASLETQSVDLNFGTIERYQWGTWPEAVPHNRTMAPSSNERPEWIGLKAPEPDNAPNKAAKFLSPSNLGGEKALPGEAAMLDSEAAMRRGEHLHLLLEKLPHVPRSDREQYAHFILNNAEDPALPEEVLPLLNEAEGVLDASFEWDIFGANSLAETRYTSDLDGQGIHGIIDRLIITSNKVQIVDFKSNAVVPETIAQIPNGLLRQLAAYADAIKKMYPGHEIETALLWTRTATLQIVPIDIVMSSLPCTATS